MVCPSLTVVAPLPNLAVNSWGFAVENADVGTCTRSDIIGKGVQFILNITSDKPAYVDLDLAYTGPSGSKTFPYRNVAINTGTANYIFTAGGELYAAGPYNMANPGHSNIRNR